VRVRSAGVIVVRRIGVFTLALLLAVGVGAPSAFAWCNGPDNGNGFGTHDWVLHEAIRLAGPDASWVDEPIALAATDDPDQEADRFDHIFLNRPRYGGAPQRVTDLYFDAVTAYAGGDAARASTCLGLLSHYYSDVLNPFHTSYAAIARSSNHIPYELALIPYTRRPGQNEQWIVTVARKRMVDVRLKTVLAARYSRARFPRLFGGLAATATIDIAANDLADIIGGIRRAEGLSFAPATVKVTISDRRPSRSSRVYAYAKCADATGKPVEGARVRFLWPLSSGQVATVTAITGPSGVAYSSRVVGALPLWGKASVRAEARSSGTVRRGSTWFVPSVALHDGLAGFRVGTSALTPARESTVTAWAIALSRSGARVPGLRVSFSWRFRTVTVTRTAVTDAAGVARCPLDIGPASRGYRVGVTARAVATTTRWGRASFVPR
jgi:hypothetical protein